MALAELKRGPFTPLLRKKGECNKIKNACPTRSSSMQKTVGVPTISASLFLSGYLRENKNLNDDSAPPNLPVKHVCFMRNLPQKSSNRAAFYMQTSFELFINRISPLRKCLAAHLLTPLKGCHSIPFYCILLYAPPKGKQFICTVPSIFKQLTCSKVNLIFRRHGFQILFW